MSFFLKKICLLSLCNSCFYFTTGVIPDNIIIIIILKLLPVPGV